MPITNSGSDARMSEIVETTWSTGRSRRIAVQTPIMIDSGTATAAEITTRKSEFPTRSDRSSPTGACRRRVAEVPGHDPAEPLDVLRHDRLVEVELVAQRRQARGRRLASQDRLRRI